MYLPGKNGFGTISQNSSCHFGVLREKGKKCTHKNTHIEMIPYMLFSTLLFSVLYFFSGFPGKEDFSKFISSNNGLNRGRKKKY